MRARVRGDADVGAIALTRRSWRAGATNSRSRPEIEDLAVQARARWRRRLACRFALRLAARIWRLDFADFFI